MAKTRNIYPLKFFLGYTVLAIHSAMQHLHVYTLHLPYLCIAGN